MSRRFTIDGSDALERHLEAICQQVLTGVRKLVPNSRLDGLLLGGGYGRGEGGVLKSAAGDQPYNDLEFYVFVRGRAFLAERSFRQPLHELGESLSPQAGLQVEFKVLTLDKLARSSPSMFYYDLVAGHRWQMGDDTMLARCQPHRDPAMIPLHEATRLLMNRCSGLLFSAERLARRTFNEADADYVGRNLAKAQLAFGDVWLTAHGQYHWSCMERHARLGREATTNAVPLAELTRHHASGVEFKLHPARSTESRADLAARHAELNAIGEKLWLWLESKRLEKNFRSARDYACCRTRKCPETSSLRNRPINGRAFGASGLLCGRYPRERLLNALALMLWEPAALADTALRQRIQQQLRTKALDLPGVVSAYSRIWNRFN
jgi:hypothetical protein